MADSHEDNYGRRLSRRIARHLRGTMVGGLLLLVPVIITYVVLKWLFDAIDGLLQPAIQEAFNRDVPGLGLLVLIVLLYVAGLVGGNFLGRRIIDLGRAMLLRIPIIGMVYSSAKQLIDALSGAESSSFRQVVMIEYPRKDAWTIGFLTGSTTDKDGNPLSIIYIPTAPTPNSGWVALIPDGDVFYTDLTVSTAMRLVLSGGIIAPSMITTSQAS
ncbi:MAG: DUF502 domain-containing protein [Chloroflexi bacterium]|nr:DUF502 domain-containing protein [Chloroflexota bacterium]